MNIKKLSRSKQLATDTLNVRFGLKEAVADGMFIDARVTSSTLRNNSSYIGVEVLLREHGEIITKQIAFSVVNDVIYSAIPLVGLCNEPV
jgi:hypothetical protein